MTIGERIRLMRKIKGKTQKQLGDACGMADSAIRKYESGRQIPKTETLQRIASALEVSMWDLLGEDFPDHPASPYLGGGIVSAILAHGYTVDLQFDSFYMGFYDMIPGAKPPEELYRITDTQTHRSVVFTGDELRAFASDHDKLIQGISDKVNHSIVDRSAPEAELKSHIGVLRTRPECRTLLSLAAESTKTEVEAAIAMLQALRGRPTDHTT